MLACTVREERRACPMHLPCPPAFKEPSTSSRPKSMSRSERPNWPPENLTHLHQVLKIKTPSPPETYRRPDCVIVDTNELRTSRLLNTAMGAALLFAIRQR